MPGHSRLPSSRITFSTSVKRDLFQDNFTSWAYRKGIRLMSRPEAMRENDHGRNWVRLCRMRDASTDGLTLPVAFASRRVQAHEARNNDGPSGEKERRTKRQRERESGCVRVHARMRVTGIIFGLNRTKFSSRPVSSVSYGPPCDFVTRD